MVDALHDAVDRIDGRAVVVGSTDPAVFCAGADLTVSDDERRHVSDRLHQLYERLLSLDVPVVAAVSGAAVGAGAQLAVSADLRVAGQQARLRFPGVGHGLVVGGWGLPSLVGRGRALDLCLTMRWVSADEALAMGLVDRVVDDARASAVALAAAIARQNPAAVSRLKHLVIAHAGLRAAVEDERAGNADAWSGSIAGLDVDGAGP